MLKTRAGQSQCQAENFERARRSATRYELLSTYGAHAELYGPLQSQFKNA